MLRCVDAYPAKKRAQTRRKLFVWRACGNTRLCYLCCCFSLCQVYRVEARSLPGHETKATFVKGKVQKVAEGKLTASIEFPEKAGQYEVTTTVGGIPHAEPFCVQVKERFHSPRRKLALLGENYDSVQKVAEALRSENAVKHFKDVGLDVKLWGFQVSSITDKKLRDAVALASMNNVGTYLYVWNYEDGDLSKENLSFWLSNLRVKARDAEVIFVGLQLSRQSGEKLDGELECFREFHPNLSATILMGDLSKGVEDFTEKIGSRMQAQYLKEPVWSEMEKLATKVEDKLRDLRTKALTRTELKVLAGMCNIGGENNNEYCNLVRSNAAGLSVVSHLFLGHRLCNSVFSLLPTTR